MVVIKVGDEYLGFIIPISLLIYFFKFYSNKKIGLNKILSTQCTEKRMLTRVS